MDKAEITQYLNEQALAGKKRKGDEDEEDEDDDEDGGKEAKHGGHKH